jgi:hypothetical protein
MTARRRRLYYPVNWALREHGVPVLWWALYDDLMAGGRHWLKAFAIAQRRIEIAIRVRLLSPEQTDLAAQLGVSLSTVKADARALRRVVSSLPDERSGLPALPRPKTPDEVPAECRRRRR